MKTRLSLVPALLVVAALAAGCGKTGDPLASSSTSGSSEEAAVSAVLAAVPEMLEDGEFVSEEETLLEGGPAGSLAAIRPLRWWRTVVSAPRRFEFAFGDSDSTGAPTRAVVTIHRQISGTFNIATRGADTVPPPDSLLIIRKRLQDRWVRRVLLERVRLTRAGAPVWRVAATSGVSVTSNGATSDIKSLRIQTATFDTTITDPLAFMWLRRVVKVGPNEPVTLTVDTGRDGDVVALMFHGGRRRFQSNGDGTYTGEWQTPYRAGLRHVGVNALSNGTVFDDQAPYDSKAWILPYVVVGHDLAAYLP